MMKTGMTNDSFHEMYDKQIEFQSFVCNKIGYNVNDSLEYKDLVIPQDVPSLSSYHIQALIAEIGEVLHADKRWKNYRADNIDMENKKEELADCFIVLMNIAMFSGFNGKEMAEAIINKIDENTERVQSL